MPFSYQPITTTSTIMAMVLHVIVVDPDTRQPIDVQPHAALMDFSRTMTLVRFYGSVAERINNANTVALSPVCEQPADRYTLDRIVDWSIMHESLVNLCNGLRDKSIVTGNDI